MAAFFLGSKLGQAILIGLALVAAFGLWSAHERAIGAEHAIAAEKAKTEQEIARREEVIANVQSQARAYADQLRQKDKRNATLLQRLHALSARHDAEPCWDADSVRRLREIGQPAGK